jgi:hypothetical protein
MNDMGKWGELFKSSGDGDPVPIDDVLLPSVIPVHTTIWEDGQHGIVIGNVDVMRVPREHVGLALEIVYATIRRIRDYKQAEQTS